MKKRIIKPPLEQVVETLLDRDPSLRNSDKKLLIRVWDYQGLKLNQSQIRTFIEDCSPAETITRIRRKLKVQYPPSKEVEQARFEKFTEFRQKYSNKRFFYH
jgi:hypothetical protein